MSVARVTALARSPLGRIVTGAIGLAVVGLIVRAIGVGVVAKTILGAAALFPLVLLFEVAQLCCTMMGLRSLYAPERVPPAQLVRAGLIGYFLMALVPVGRAAAEIARASMLSRFVGTARAAAAATRIQGAALLGNGFISVFATAAAFWAHGPGDPWWVPLAIAANTVLVLGLGVSVLFAGRAKAGAWFGKKVPKAQQVAAEFDALVRSEPLLPLGAIFWESCARVFQTLQAAVLLACVGGSVTVANALNSEGILLVGGAIGDLIPAQVGATEGYYSISAAALGLTTASAVSIALLAHLAQLFWTAVGAVVSAVWPAKEVPARADAATPLAPLAAEGKPTP